MASGNRRPFWTARRKEALAGWGFAAPWIVGFLFLSLGPMVFSLFLSLHTWDSITPIENRTYVGLDNYRRMVTSREDWADGEREIFLKSLGNTAYYAAVSVPLGLVIALGLAMLLNQPVRGLALWRTIFYLPSIVSGVATYVLWMWLFQPQFGLLNTLLGRFGIEGPAWLASPAWAKPALIVMGLWSVGSGMLIFLAGLQQVPRALYEAAAIDGAGAWARFRHVTVPHLTPLIFFNLVMGTIGALQVFAQAYVMTGGGPANSTLFFVLYIFEKAFDFHEMGYACALAWVLFAIALALTLALLRSSRLWVFYEARKA